MLVDTAPTAPPTVVRRARGAPPGAPLAAGARPSRRALLGLAATAGATAAAARLAGPATEALLGPSSLDPASALHVRVTGLTTDVDPVPAVHGGHGAISGGPPTTLTGADGLGARVWSRTVTVSLVVRNAATRAVLFSPGQVRLRLGDGTGVMPVDSGLAAGALPGGTSTRTWVRFLAPQDETELAVDYLPAGTTEPVPLAVHAEAAGHAAGDAR